MYVVYGVGGGGEGDRGGVRTHGSYPLISHCLIGSCHCYRCD